MTATRPEVMEWGAEKCLRWLAEHAEKPNHYAERSRDWPGEVARFAEHEGIDADEWEQQAEAELQAEVCKVAETLSRFELVPVGDICQPNAWNVREYTTHYGDNFCVFRGDLSPIRGKRSAYQTLRRMYPGCRIRIAD